MLYEGGVFAVNAQDAELIVEERERAGWLVIRLPTEISSKDDFFEGIRFTVPLDPPLQSNRSWDALADSLWGGLERLTASGIVIVWPTTSEMEKNAYEHFTIATKILTELSDSLGDISMTAGKVKALLVLLVN